MVNLERIAKRVVQECLRVKEGENFLINCGDFAYWDFAEEVAKAAIEVGAYPFITVTSDEIALKRYQNSVEYLKKPSEYVPALLKVADVSLDIVFPKDPMFTRDVPKEKLAASSIASIPIWETLYEKNKDRANIRKSSFLYPTVEQARSASMSFEEYADMVWSAVDIDYDALSKRAKQLRDVLSKGDVVHITTEDGTDFKFSIKNRRVFMDDGILDEEDIETNSFLQNLPTGEVYVPPVETSAEGVAVFQYNIFMGEPLVNLKATFKDGEIVDMEADKGLSHFKGVMDKNTVDKYRIAELGIGLNPKITKVTGELALDEKIIGTVHIAVGENRMFGGSNKASIHWDLVMMKPTVYVDDVKIMDQGQFAI